LANTLDYPKSSGAIATDVVQSPARTTLAVTNSNAAGVTVFLTLGAVVGCVASIDDVPPIMSPALPIDKVNDLQGSFILKSGASVSFLPPVGVGISGNFAFGTPPLNCATPQCPSGVNVAEFMLNNGFQTGIPQESIDISAVAGVNALLEFSMTGGGAWNAGSTQPNVASFQNNKIGDNVGQVGVFPYGCDVCTGSANPPQCAAPPAGAPSPPVPQTESICLVQRDASQAGGTVLVTFNSFA
jgi:hypothetical protein